MKLSLDLRTSLTQTLTPQQIQYLKLLQLPLIQLEQQVRQEIEANPMLEEPGGDDPFDDLLDGTAEPDFTHEEYVPERDIVHDEFGADPIHKVAGDDYDGINMTSFDDGGKSMIDDQVDPFDFYKAIWQDDADFSGGKNSHADDDDYEPFQIKDNSTFAEDLYQQLRLLPMSEEEFLIGAQIIGNIDDDGYLRRELQEIVDETNSFIAEHNFQIQKELYESQNSVPTNYFKDNPARMYALSDDSASALARVVENAPDLLKNPFAIELLRKLADKKSQKSEKAIINQVRIDQADKVLSVIQSLDPPGIGSRSISECLIAQCKAFTHPSPAQSLALRILQDAYDAFAKKHYPVLLKQFEIEEQELKDAIDVIRRLNPKPGGGDYQSEVNTVIPDFIIDREEDTNELIITVNDANMPQLRLNKAYERLKRDAKTKKFNKDTREWIRNKFEDAKFLIQAIRQRKTTMLKVMTSIASFQRSFFEEGRSGVKPLIYKDVAEETGLDISTVCRIVNGKYVQTEYGTYELKYFFSESLPNDDGEDVSTTVIKEIIKGMIDEEPKDKPLSDDKISKDLKDKGYNVARRTVAKYREQLRIPVARLRKEL